ncbi:hypothetical protein B0H19DRAFT_1064947 [Mycena capillaripes]|nr:hypothetical protein B0H19DRAFT_1064947 [Mycena capillaripes]
MEVPATTAAVTTTVTIVRFRSSKLVTAKKTLPEAVLLNLLAKPSKESKLHIKYLERYSLVNLPFNENVEHEKRASFCCNKSPLLEILLSCPCRYKLFHQQCIQNWHKEKDKECQELVQLPASTETSAQKEKKSKRKHKKDCKRRKQVKHVEEAVRRKAMKQVTKKAASITKAALKTTALTEGHREGSSGKGSAAI